MGEICVLLYGNISGSTFLMVTSKVKFVFYKGDELLKIWVILSSVLGRSTQIIGF